MARSIHKPSFRLIVAGLALLVAAVVSIRVVTVGAGAQQRLSSQRSRSGAVAKPTSPTAARAPDPSGSLGPSASSPNVYAAIGPGTARVIRTIHRIEHPYNLYFTPDGSMAIVVAEYYNRLDFYDPHTWSLIRSVPMPCNGPDHADFSADGSTFLISCEFDG